MAVSAINDRFVVPQRVTPEEAADGLRLIGSGTDQEVMHYAADEVLVALLRFYGAPQEVIAAYSDVPKWYA